MNLSFVTGGIAVPGGRIDASLIGGGRRRKLTTRFSFPTQLSIGCIQRHKNAAAEWQIDCVSIGNGCQIRGLIRLVPPLHGKRLRKRYLIGRGKAGYRRTR